MTRDQQQQKVASVLCNYIAQQLVIAHPMFRDGGERVTLDCSVAMIGITAASVALANAKGGEEFVPTPDHI